MCDCFNIVDQKLEPLGAAVDWAFMIHPKTGRMQTRPQIKVRKLDPKSRKSLPILSAGYCPFCGQEFPRAPEGEQVNGDGGL